MILWGVAFGLMKAVFMHNYDDEETFKVSDPSALDHYDKYIGHWKTMMDGAWVNLAGLALFLISGTMGVLMWCVGRRTAGAVRGGKAIKAGVI
ncbi:hypothetical protein LTR51_004106 [Lithohypha guttulata]|nr:hypothetical protein LTR51_004106 [Lithohypha guttulata]